MSNREKSSFGQRVSRLFGLKATRVSLFALLAVASSAGFYELAKNKGGITSGLDDLSQLVADVLPRSVSDALHVGKTHLIVHLDASNARMLLNPKVDKLQPKPFTILTCEEVSESCQRQLKEDEKAAELMQDVVDFYFLDPAIEEAVYNAVYAALDQSVPGRVPVTFPNHSVWTVAFSFKGSKAHAGVKLVQFSPDSLPAGGVIKLLKQSLGAAKAAQEQAEEKEKEDQEKAKTKEGVDAGKTRPEAAPAEKPAKAEPEAKGAATGAVQARTGDDKTAGVQPGATVQPELPGAKPLASDRTAGGTEPSAPNGK